MNNHPQIHTTYMNQLLKFVAKRLAIFLFFFTFVSVITLGAQSPEGLDTSSPANYLGDVNFMLLQSAITAALSYFASFIPGANRLSPYVRTVVAALLVVGVFFIFKKDALQMSTFQFIITNFGTTLLGSNGVWSAFRRILGLFGIDIKPKPTVQLN